MHNTDKCCSHYITCTLTICSQYCFNMPHNTHSYSPSTCLSTYAGPLKDEAFLVGYHTHTSKPRSRPRHSPFPGGKMDIILPPEAPSRAYLKIQEALLWSEAPLKSGDVVVEIGSAPGGASLALLNRGCTVVGIGMYTYISHLVLYYTILLTCIRSFVYYRPCPSR